MKQALPHVLSAITLLGIYLTGRKSWVGWAVGLGNQTLWAAFIASDWENNAGLSWLAVALTFLYTKNLIRWRREERDLAARPECPVRWDPELGTWVHRGGYRGVDGPADRPVNTPVTS
jgi:hypothetical protein